MALMKRGSLFSCWSKNHRKVLTDSTLHDRGILSTYTVLEVPEECQNLADARQDAKTNLLCERELFTCPLTLFLSGTTFQTACTLLQKGEWNFLSLQFYSL